MTWITSLILHTFFILCDLYVTLLLPQQEWYLYSALTSTWVYFPYICRSDSTIIQPHRVTHIFSKPAVAPHSTLSPCWSPYSRQPAVCAWSGLCNLSQFFQLLQFFSLAHSPSAWLTHLLIFYPPPPNTCCFLNLQNIFSSLLSGSCLLHLKAFAQRVALTEAILAYPIKFAPFLFPNISYSPPIIYSLCGAHLLDVPYNSACHLFVYLHPPPLKCSLHEDRFLPILFIPKVPDSRRVPGI